MRVYHYGFFFYVSNFILQLTVETFNPIDWNADKIVSDAIDSGVQYIVFTSKHHEGFSMFNTNVSGFKSFSLTGYGTYKGV